MSFFSIFLDVIECTTSTKRNARAVARSIIASIMYASFIATAASVLGLLWTRNGVAQEAGKAHSPAVASTRPSTTPVRG
jgi:hypothetical protein